MIGKTTENFVARDFLQDIDFPDEPDRTDYYDQKDHVLQLVLNASDGRATVYGKFNKAENSYQVIEFDEESEGFLKNLVYHATRKGYTVHIRDDMKSKTHLQKVSVNAFMLKLRMIDVTNVKRLIGYHNDTKDEVVEFFSINQPDVFVISFMDGEYQPEILDTLHKANKRNNSITFIVLVN